MIDNYNKKIYFDSNSFMDIFGKYLSLEECPDPRLQALYAVYSNIELRLTGRYCRYSLDVCEDISKLSTKVFDMLSVPSRDIESLDDDYIVAVVIGYNSTNVVDCTMSEYLRYQSEYSKIPVRDKPKRPLYLEKLADTVFVSDEPLINYSVLCHVKTLDENTAITEMIIVGVPYNKLPNEDELIKSAFNI